MHVRDGDVQALGAAGAAPGHSWFDIKLLIKLGFLLAVLGQSSTTSHIAVMVSVAVLVYCAQVGILRYVLDRVRAMGQPQRHQLADPANANPGPGGANQLPQGGGMPQLGNIPHATTGGACTDLQVFFMGLFMSLIPSWAPIGMNAPIIIPIQADEPDAIEPAVGAAVGGAPAAAPAAGAIHAG